MAKQVGAAWWPSQAPPALRQLQRSVLLMGAEILCLELCSSLAESAPLTKSPARSRPAPRAGETIPTRNGFVAFALFCSSICFLGEGRAQARGGDQINKSGPAAKALGIFVLR